MLEEVIRVAPGSNGKCMRDDKVKSIVILIWIDQQGRENYNALIIVTTLPRMRIRKFWFNFRKNWKFCISRQNITFLRNSLQVKKEKVQDLMNLLHN